MNQKRDLEIVFQLDVNVPGVLCAFHFPQVQLGALKIRPADLNCGKKIRELFNIDILKVQIRRLALLAAGADDKTCVELVAGFGYLAGLGDFVDGCGIIEIA